MATKRNNKLVYTFSITMDEVVTDRMIRRITEINWSKTRFAREAIREKLDRDAPLPAEQPKAAPTPRNGKKRKRR